jgi:hypothetical protein
MKYLEELKALNLPIGEYVVFGSGPLSIRGLRENKDIDIVVTEKLWKIFTKGRYVKGDMLQITTHVEAICNPETVEDINKLIKTADIIQGVPFASLEQTIKFKTKKGREKDFKDIELIKKYLASKN